MMENSNNNATRFRSHPGILLRAFASNYTAKRGKPVSSSVLPSTVRIHSKLSSRL